MAVNQVGVVHILQAVFTDCAGGFHSGKHKCIGLMSVSLSRACIVSDSHCRGIDQASICLSWCLMTDTFVCISGFGLSFSVPRYLVISLMYSIPHLMALCPGLPGWAGTRKVKPIWILLKQETVSGSGIGWDTCKSAPRSRQITTPAPHHSVFYRPDALLATQPAVSKHWRHSVDMELTAKMLMWHFVGHLCFRPCTQNVPLLRVLM